MRLKFQSWESDLKILRDFSNSYKIYNLNQIKIWIQMENIEFKILSIDVLSIEVPFEFQLKSIFARPKITRAI